MIFHRCFTARSTGGRLALLLLPAFGVLAGLTLGGCGKGSSQETKTEDATPAPATVEIAVAAIHPMETVATAQGALEPEQGRSAKIAPLASGRLLDVRVKEGDRVTAGEIVALLDDRPLKAQEASASAALRSAEALSRQSALDAIAVTADNASALELARLSLRSARQDRDASIRQANTALQAAQTELDKAKAGARPQEIAQTDQAVKQAEASRNRARTEADRTRSLYQKGIDSKRQLEDDETALTVADSAYESAKQQASLLRAGSRPEEIRAAELAVEGARETLDQAKTSGDAKVSQAREELKRAMKNSLQIEVKRQEAQAAKEAAAQKRADLDAAIASETATTLRSPIDGTVVHRQQNPGDMADPAAPILEIADSRALDLNAKVAVEDGLKIRSGMTARVTLPDLPNRAFAGHVLSVGDADPQTNLMTVRIRIPNAGGRLKIGAFAIAEIVLRREERAVVIPKDALLTRDGKTILFVVGPDEVAHERKATVGTERDGLAEIVIGLKPGEKVIRLGQYELSDGMKVKPAASGEADSSGGTDHAADEKKAGGP